MRRFMIVCLAGVVALAAAGCGGKKEAQQQAAGAAREPATQDQQSATEERGGGEADLVKGMQEFARAMESMQKSPDGKAYEPVSFRSLIELLPDVPGWEKEEPEGESTTAPVRFSQASAGYTKGDARIEVKIVDTAMSRLLTMPYQMFLAAGYSKESTSGYEKAVKVKGQPGWEKWNSESKTAELGVIVGERFLVTVEGSGADIKDAQAVAGRLDMAKLAALK
ncbi:MAG TPA: hypothetical protein PLN93_07240 [Vicinamibacterales bacterium]|nr:hypothetical protein [Vicinamibacterales bacterium]HPK71720.1 hypothetical protein [Vicinamibacterales bacterium]